MHLVRPLPARARATDDLFSTPAVIPALPLQALPVLTGPWGIYTGDSFMNQAQPGIDYHSTHLWVDNWDVAEPNSEDDTSVATSAPNPATSFAFDRTWLSTREAVAQADGRPFIIEEWGETLFAC